MRTTWGRIDAKYGTRAMAAAENAQLPPGNGDIFFQARYVGLGCVMRHTLLKSKFRAPRAAASRVKRCGARKREFPPQRFIRGAHGWEDGCGRAAP